MRILFVEDEKTLADAVIKILQKNNFLVDYFDNGLDGFYAAQSAIYDVIVLDVMLPKKNGFEILKDLRQLHIQTPVMLLTARSAIQDKAMGFELGADDYLTKPFQASELMMRIKALARRKGEVTDFILEVGNLRLNTNNCILTCNDNGKSMQLSAKEYQMMEYMMKNADSIISKEMFLEKIWGYESDAEYNSVEVYISFLRKKLKFLDCNVVIRAVRGIGYVLEAEN